MPSYNKWTGIGNLTRDPEMKYLPSGDAVTSITLACNRNWTDQKTGEKKEEVTFIDCTAFGRTAEVVAQFTRKGRPLLVEGRLKQEQWEDKTTHEKRSKLKVIIDHVVLLGSPQDGDGKPEGAETPPRTRTAPRATAGQQARGQAAAENAQADDDSGEIPF